MKLIVDASVAIKWFFEESYNREADLLLSENYDLYAPDFILVETASVLWKKRRMGELNSFDDRETLSTLREALKTLLLSAQFVERSLELAIELDHSPYDCLYLAAAESSQSVLVTADREFFNRVSASPYSSLIAWIENPTTQ